MKRRRQMKWLLALLLITGFSAVAFLQDMLAPLDQSVSAAVAQWRSPTLTGIMHFITNLASAPILVVLSLAGLLAVKQRRYYVPLLANLGISVMLNLGLKDLFTRPRPSHIIPLVTEAGYSFPSGHSMAAAAFYGFILYIVWRSAYLRRARRHATPLLLVLIVLIGFSRIYLGVHFLSDVLAGFLASGLYLLVYTSFVDAYFLDEQHIGDLLTPAQPTLVHSFAHAIDGIIGSLRAERNIVIHFGVMTLVIIMGLLLRCSAIEWCILLILFSLVLAAELFNTAIEACVDLHGSAFHDKAKLAKDPPPAPCWCAPPPPPSAAS